jgi:hypothetical protein
MRFVTALFALMIAAAAPAVDPVLKFDLQDIGPNLTGGSHVHAQSDYFTVYNQGTVKIFPAASKAAAIAAYAADPTFEGWLSVNGADNARIAFAGTDASSWSLIANNTTTGRTMAARFADEYNVKDFGAVGDDSHDDTAAIQAAITQAAADHNRTVFFPCGTYKVTTTEVVPQGVFLKGSGSQGSTVQYGTTIDFQSNSDLFKWDSSGASASSTGGGISNMLILKATTFNGGGRAVYCLAIDDNHRPGEMLFQNVLIAGVGTGTWSRCMHFDGTACNTSGTVGLRSVYLYKVRVAGATTANQSILFDQVVHLEAAGLEIDDGNGGGSPGMEFSHGCDGVVMPGLEIYGSIVVDDAVNVITLGGRCNTLTVNDASVANPPLTMGGFHGYVQTSIVNHSSLFKLRSNLNSQFCAHRSNNDAGATGDGTLYNPIFNVTDYDVGTNLSGTAGTFTATQAGRYRFVCVTYCNGGSAATSATLDLVKTAGSDAGASSQTFRTYGNKLANIQNGGNFQLRAEAEFVCNYGDVVKPALTVSGAAANAVNVGGSGSQNYTYWEASLAGQ